MATISPFASMFGQIWRVTSHVKVNMEELFVKYSILRMLWKRQCHEMAYMEQKRQCASVCRARTLGVTATGSSRPCP
jgi:hypothetical protein